MKYTLEILTVFESGKRVDADGHPHQEDCLYPTAEALTPAARLFVLCDGMGGHEAGEVASDAVCRAYGRVVEESKEWRNGRFPDSLLQAATTAAYDALDLLPETGQGRTPGTTMTLLALHEEGATVAHLGDSRVYHFRPGKTAEDTVLLFQTRDHSLVNQLLDLGELSPEEVENFPRRNVITRAMQPRLDVRFKPAVTHITDIRPGDYFMLCSDGILEHIEETNLRYVFSEEGGDLAAKRDKLLRATEENSDNHSAFIVRVVRVEGAGGPTAETLQDEDATTPPQPNNSTQPIKPAAPEKPRSLVSTSVLGAAILFVLIAAAVLLFIL